MKTLISMSDKELTNRLRKLTRKEQDLTLEILPFLAEVDRRELYLGWGCGSLTEYCMSHLGYCESSAWRRVRVARTIKNFPEVYDLLRQGRLTVSAIIVAAKVLKRENKVELLPRLLGKSQGEVKRIVAEYERPQIIQDQARPRIVMKQAKPKLAIKPVGENKLGEIPLHSEGKKLATDTRLDRSGPSTSDENSTPLPNLTETAFEKMYEVRFAADEELMEVMRWMKSYLSNRFPEGVSFLEMFKFAMSYVREREDLGKRAGRRTKKTTRKSPATSTAKTTSRHIPMRVREKVWTRDGGKCSYVGSCGKRCNSKHNLQFDHYPVPFARGGPSTASNLRLLCAKHNRYTAGQIYGKKHMEQYRPRQE